MVRELKELLEKYKRDGRSTPGPPQKNNTEIMTPKKANRAAGTTPWQVESV